LRKRHGAIEKEYFIPINRKISEININLNDKSNSKKENTELHEKLNLTLIEQEKIKKESEEIYTALKKIIDNLSIENLNGKDYPIINLSENELEKIEQLIL
jgi:hypothetical protein